MKTLQSILTIEDPKTGNKCVVVCTFLQDEKAVLRAAEKRGHRITSVVTCEDAMPITLDDYEF